MSITRTMAETVLVKRVGPAMTAAGMVVTIVGSNADLNDPLAWAVRAMGSTTSDIATTNDTEMASITDYSDFLDLVEYRVLQNILGALDDTDLTVGPRTEKLSQLAAQVQKKLDRLEKRLSGLLHEVETGYISLSFVEHGENIL